MMDATSCCSSHTNCNRLYHHHPPVGVGTAVLIDHAISVVAAVDEKVMQLGFSFRYRQSFHSSNYYIMTSLQALLSQSVLPKMRAFLEAFIKLRKARITLTKRSQGRPKYRWENIKQDFFFIFEFQCIISL